MNPELIAHKTRQGRIAVNNRDEDLLPRPLRMLLIMIDGRSPVKRYKKLLANYSGVREFGNLENMLDALSELGLIGFNDVSGVARPANSRRGNQRAESPKESSEQ